MADKGIPISSDGHGFDLENLEPTSSVAVADETPDVARETPVATDEPSKAPKVDKTGRVHGDDGKFARKVIDDVQGSGALEEAIEPATDPAASAPDAVAPAVEPVAAAPQDEPWQFHGRGKPVVIPGALYRKGVGVFIPEKVGETDVLGDVRARLVRAEQLPEIQASNAALRQQLDTGYTQQSLENAAMKEAFGALITPEGMNQLIDDINKLGADVVREKLAIALQMKQLEIQRELSKSGAQMVEAPGGKEGGASPDVVRAAYQTLEDVFEASLRSEWPDITPAQKQELEGRIVSLAPAMFERASTDDPSGHWFRGGIAVKRGELETFIRGMRNGHRPTASPAAPPASSVRPVPPAPSKPVQVPPSGAGAATNIAGKGVPTKPTPKGSFATKEDYQRYLASNDV